MEKLVVDTSVAVKWFVVENHTPDALRILAAYQSGAISLLAPDLIYTEFGNIIWKKHRFEGMAISDGEQIIHAFRSLSWVITDSSELIEEAYRQAVSLQRSVYDAVFLALSAEERCPFVTATWHR